MSVLSEVTREHLIELAPVLRRAVTLDPGGLARMRSTEHRVSALVRLPFGVLVARTLATSGGQVFDVTVSAAEMLAWLDGEQSAAPPTARDADWRTSVPPVRGWQRIDTVPDEVVRSLVHAGARTLKAAAEREGVPGARPRAAVSDALLDSVVLTVTAASGEPSAALTLRTLSALNRMGFLSRGSHVAVDIAGRWIRAAAEYGSVYSARPGAGLQLL